MARGAMVNALSPHPWLFWATVGGPTLIAAYNQAPSMPWHSLPASTPP